MQLFHTQHARQQMERREISAAWVERVVVSPTHRMRDPGDSTVERFYAPGVGCGPERFEAANTLLGLCLDEHRDISAE